MHVGKIISLTATAITMSHDNGSPNCAHAIAAGATVTLNGNASKLADLKAGDAVTLNADPATSVVATGSR